MNRFRRFFPNPVMITVASMIWLANAGWAQESTEESKKESTEELTKEISFARASLQLQIGDLSHKLCVELADSPHQQAKGLMERKSLGRNHGMLFRYPKPQMVSFWMKNTPIPLDIVFITKQGAIGHVAQNTTPFSLTPIASPTPVLWVLEIVADRARQLGLRAGRKIIWRLGAKGSCDFS